MRKSYKQKDGPKQRLRAREVLKINRLPMIFTSMLILAIISSTIYITYTETGSFITKFSPSTE